MNKKSINMCLVLRVIIGLFFTVVAVENLLSPVQNFLYVIEGYDVFPPKLAQAAAYTVPWIELLLGVFLVVGLWLPWVLRVFMAFLLAFIGILGQALWRDLPLNDCGCFGELISLPLHVTIILDFGLLLCIVYLFKKLEKTGQLSLDKYFG